MHKVLLLLGLLLQGPMYGYELNRIVRAHGELFTDLKKANLYHLLDLLAREDSLTVQAETGTRGRRGERLIYTLTAKGQSRFRQLLEEQVRSYEISHTGMEVAIVFLTYLPLEQAISLLQERYQTILARRHAVEAELLQMRARSPEHMAPPERLTANRLAADHLFLLIDAELSWTQHARDQLRAHGWQSIPMRPADPATES